jgi:hypothetical protein
VLERAIADRLREAVEIRQQHVARLPHLQCLRRVDDVGGGEPEGRGRTDFLPPRLNARRRAASPVRLRAMSKAAGCRARPLRAMPSRHRSRRRSRRATRYQPRWSLQIRPIAGCSESSHD